MSAFTRVLRVGIKAESSLTRFRASKSHSTSSSSSAEEFSQLVKSTGTRPRPVDTVTPGREADKFRGDRGLENEKGLSGFNLEVAEFVATLHEVDRDVSEFMRSKFEAARNRMAFLGIGCIACCTAICYAFVGKQGSSKEVDGLSP